MGMLSIPEELEQVVQRLETLTDQMGICITENIGPPPGSGSQTLFLTGTILEELSTIAEAQQQPLLEDQLDMYSSEAHELGLLTSGTLPANAVKGVGTRIAQLANDLRVLTLGGESTDTSGELPTGQRMPRVLGTGAIRRAMGNGRMI